MLARPFSGNFRGIDRKTQVVRVVGVIAPQLSISQPPKSTRRPFRCLKEDFNAQRAITFDGSHTAKEDISSRRPERVGWEGTRVAR